MDTDSENKIIDADAEAVEITKPAKEKKAARVRKPAKEKKAARVRKPAKEKKAVVRRRGRTELGVDEMTQPETELLGTLFTPSGPRVAMALHELQDKIWPKKPGTSLVRNTLRRLVKFGWIELAPPSKAAIAAHAKARVGRLYSKYQVTEKGRKRGIKS